MRKLFLIVGLLGLLAPGLARAQLISQPDAARYGLHRSWYNQVAVDGNSSRLEYITLGDSLLLTQTSEGLLDAWEAETGRRVWSNRIGTAKSPNIAPGIDKNFVAASSGTQIYLFDAPSGT